MARVAGHDGDEGADEHLCNLQGGDGLRKGPGDVGEADSHEEVVEVHDGVDGVVHRAEPDARCRHGVEGVPAVQHDRDVVEPVQEDHILALQHEEHRVQQLGGSSRR